MKLLKHFLCRKEKHLDDDDGDDPSHKDMEKGGVILTHPPQLDMGLLLHNLTLRLKVRQAAILDLHGNVVHMTPDFSLPPDDCASLQRVLHAAPTAGMWRLSLLGHHFRCFHCTGDATVLGYSATTVMAAHVTRRHLVLGLAPEDVPGSCLHEMMQVWDQIEAQGM